ncbi:MAG: hypothetical protein LBD06_11095 [Candidatus Accumulibacter sp.]|nr:hypothetical protein [Accumulibacter sp.]
MRGQKADRFERLTPCPAETSNTVPRSRHSVFPTHPARSARTHLSSQAPVL